MLQDIKNTIMAGIYISMGAIVYLMIPDKIIASCFFALGIFLVTNYHSMLITRVVPMYFAKIDYKWQHIILAAIGNIVGGVIIAFVVSYTRLVPAISENLNKIVQAKFADSILSIFIMAIFCGIFVAYSSLTSRKYRKGSVAQLFYTAIFIVAFVICGFDHVVANGFYFGLYGFTEGFSLQIIIILSVVLAGNILGGLFTALVERKNLDIIETRRHYDK